MGLGPLLTWGETHHSPSVRIPSYIRVKPEAAGPVGSGRSCPPCPAQHFCQDVTACGGTRAQLTEAAVHGRGAMERILCQEEEGSPQALALRGCPCPCVRTCLRFLASLPQSVVTRVCQTGAGRCSTPPLFINISLYFLPWPLCVKYENLFSFL